MQYKVKYAPDEVMPQGHNWAVCQDTKEGATVLFLRQSVRSMCPEDEIVVLEEAWLAANGLAGI